MIRRPPRSTLFPYTNALPISSTQSIFAIRQGIASSLGLPQSDINVIGQTIGGGFGGKFGTLVHPYAVLLAQLTGRPVKIVYSREEEMLDGRPAPGATIWVKRSEEHTSELQSRQYLVCRLLLE